MVLAMSTTTLILNVLMKFQCMLESQDTFSVQDIYAVKGLTKPLLGRPAIQALGIISNLQYRLLMQIL
jgi:hypothetical protein